MRVCQSTPCYNKAMIVFTADVIGAEILLFQEHALLGKVSDIIFNPENGKVLGLYCFDPILKTKRVIVPSEIKRFSNHRILIEGYDSLSDPEDMIRIKEAEKVNAKIIKETVFTESGQKLGKVTGATIDTRSWELNRLYVNSAMGLQFLAKELIIPAKKIVKIDKKEIIVTDDYAKVKRFSAAPVPKPIPE
jgi:uncharacterized protein YrrD